MGPTMFSLRLKDLLLEASLCVCPVICNQELTYLDLCPCNNILVRGRFDFKADTHSLDREEDHKDFVIRCRTCSNYTSYHMYFFLIIYVCILVFYHRESFVNLFSVLVILFIKRIPYISELGENNGLS